MTAFGCVQKYRKFNIAFQRVLLRRTGRPVIWRSARGREEVVWVGPAGGPGSCGGRRGGSPLRGRESTGAGPVALIGRTVRSGKAPTSSPDLLMRPSAGKVEVLGIDVLSAAEDALTPLRRRIA